MNLTLHLTGACNMDCAYCTQEKKPVTMTKEILHAACALAFSEGQHAGFCFFGGEPLLCEDLIFEAMDLCAARSAETGKRVYYRMTTNGTLLSDRMIARAADEGMEIGISFDGTMQDICRRYKNGAGSFADTESAAKRLLAAMPRTTAMMTVAPQAAAHYAEAVRYLYELGFRNIHAVPAYGQKVSWDAEALDRMKAQLTEIAAFYSECLRADDPFYFSPIETKIRHLLSRTHPSDHCHLGTGQMPVAPDGKIYACNQFIGDAAYCLGDVFSGISRKKCAELMLRQAVPETCRSCTLRSRCLHSCGCLNRLETGDPSKVSAVHCAYEKMLIYLADETAERLYESDRARFDRYFKGKEAD